MTIETKKVASANEAIEIINRLNYRHDTFIYDQTTREDDADIKYRHFDAYRDNGEKDSFAIIEIVVNGKLEIVRFFNLFRDITVDIKLGDFNPDYSRYDEVINVDADNNAATEDETAETKIDKLFDAYESESGNKHLAHGYIATVYYQQGRELYWRGTARNYGTIDAAIDAISYVCKHDTDKITRTAAVFFKHSRFNEDKIYARNEFGVEYFTEYYDNAIVETDGSEEDDFVDEMPALFPAEDSDDDNELIDLPTDNSDATDNNRRKHYTINPPMPDEDTPVKINHVDLFITGNTLEISGFFECQKLETAYRRFRKIMAQAAHDNPQLEGWDNWVPAKKLTQDGDAWLNENGDITFFAHGGLDTLAVDINEDLFYFYGKFTNAFDAPTINNIDTATETDEGNELIDPPTMTPSDDFEAKLAALKAKQDAAKIVLDKKDAELRKAQEEYEKADKAWCETNYAIDRLLREKSDELVAKFNALPISDIRIKTTTGEEFIVQQNFGSISTLYGDFSIFANYQNRYYQCGCYKTPAQVETIINQLRAAIARGDREFTFPTIEELTAPEVGKTQVEDNCAKLEARLAELKANAEKKWKVFSDACDNYEALKKKLSDALHDDIIDDDEYEALNDATEDAEVDMTIAYDQWVLVHNTMCYAEQDLEEYDRKHETQDTETTVDKDATADSLTRAMKIALEHYQDYCRVGNLTAATNEWSLYNICRKAMTELWKGEAA